MSALYPPGPRTERVMRIRSMADECSDDELVGVEAMLVKLRAGSRKHGPLVLATDPRNWEAERNDEWLDSLWYALWFAITKSHQASAERVVAIPPKFDVSDCPDVVPIEVAGSTVMVSDIRDEDEKTGEWPAVRAEGSVG